LNRTIDRGLFDIRCGEWRRVDTPVLQDAKTLLDELA